MSNGKVGVYGNPCGKWILNNELHEFDNGLHEVFAPLPYWLRQLQSGFSSVGPFQLLSTNETVFSVNDVR